MKSDRSTSDVEAR